MLNVPALKTCPVCKKKHKKSGVFCSVLCKQISILMDDLQQVEYRIEDVEREVAELKEV